MNEVIIEVYGMSTCISYSTWITSIYPPLCSETIQNLILNWPGTPPDAADAQAEDELNIR
jgi:hypothetical protein